MIKYDDIEIKKESPDTGNTMMVRGISNKVITEIMTNVLSYTSKSRGVKLPERRLGEGMYLSHTPLQKMLDGALMISTFVENWYREMYDSPWYNTYHPSAMSANQLFNLRRGIELFTPYVKKYYLKRGDVEIDVITPKALLHQLTTSIKYFNLDDRIELYEFYLIRQLTNRG